MPTPFTCPNCGKTGRLSDQFTGDQIRCPQCKTVSPVPRKKPAQPSAPPEPTLRPLGARGSSAPPPAGGVPVGLIAAGVGAAVFAVVVTCVIVVVRTGGGGKPAADLAAATPGPGTTAPVEQTEASPSAPAAEPASAAAPDVTPVSAAGMVKRIKDATVFLKVAAGRLQGSGSGFVFRVDGDTVLVATNHHVVTPHMDTPEDMADPGKQAVRPTITAVFRSGLGAAAEQSLPATVLASDRVGNRDLAILQVKGLKNPPLPIELSRKSELTETMPVGIYGFPFGNINEMLAATARGNPAITINRGTISSIRTDEAGQVMYVQIDGSLNPGNSGGPVVDDQGRLVGVAVAGIANTQIGFAVPPGELTRMLDGRVGNLSLAFLSETGGMATVKALAALVDPLKKLKGVELLYVPAPAAGAAAPPKRGPDGSWPPLAGATRLNLARAESVAATQFQTDVKGPAGRRLLLQLAFQDASGKSVYASPVSYVIPTRPTALAAVGVPAEPGGRGRAGAALPPSFDKLGPLIDPSKTCKLTRSGTAMTIDVPPGAFLMSADFDIKNAPMTLTEIEGDFLAQVKIPGTMLPGSEPAKTKSRTLPLTYQGAGLILWIDKNNYLRLERAVKVVKRGLTMSSEVLVEICRNGKTAGYFYAKLPDGPLHVRIARLSGSVSCMFGPDGQRWLALNKLAIPFPNKLQVGLSASNASKESLSARFEQFALIVEKTQVEGAKPTDP